MSVEDGGLSSIALLLTPKASDIQLIAGILPPPIGLERLPNDLIVSTSRSFYFRLSVCLPVCLSFSLCLCLCLCLYFFLFVFMSVSVYLSLFASVCPSISVCLLSLSFLHLALTRTLS